MTSPLIHNPIPNTDEISSEETYTLEPLKDAGIGDWQEYDVLNREIQSLIDKLPNEHQIGLYIKSLQTSELRDAAVSLLRHVVSAVKDPDLYPLSCLHFLNTWFSKIEEIVNRNVETNSKVFKKLANSWHEDTDHHSFAHLITSHEAYLKIIAMGAIAISFILQDLQERGGNWYAALRALSGHDPVPPEAQGDVPVMKESWLRWGRDNGYIE